VPTITVKERKAAQCRCGHETAVELPVVLDCRHPAADATLASGDAMRCDRCGAMLEVDYAVLLYFGAALASAVFVPAERTTVEEDGREGARLVRLLEQRLGRPVIDGPRQLTSAPWRLARVIAARDPDADAVAPDRIEPPSLDSDAGGEYRRWLAAVRGDLGVAAAADATRRVLLAATWTDALGYARATPLLADPAAACAVERAITLVRAQGPANAAGPLEARARFLRTWRSRGGAPADVPLAKDGPTLATRVALEAYEAVADGPLDERIAKLREAHQAAIAVGSENRTAVALAAGLAATLHARGRADDLDEAARLLADASRASAALDGAAARSTLQVDSDLAMVRLERHTADDVRAARSAMEQIERDARRTLAPDDPFLVACRLNLGTAWLEPVPGSDDRSADQEQGIAWLEQALEAERLDAELEVIASSNLGAALRTRIARRPDDRDRAHALLDRATTLARAIHRPRDPERLVGALMMAANHAEDTGDGDRAIGLAREALRVGGDLPEMHRAVLRARANLASTLHNRFNRFRAADAAAARQALEEARSILEPTRQAMAAERHPMLPFVTANLFALLAEHVDRGRLDAAAARQLADELLGSLDPVADAELVRTVAWNAGLMYLGDGDLERGRAAGRAGWRAAMELADRALLLAARATEQRELTRHARRLALMLCDSRGERLPPIYDEAFEVLDSSRARLVGGVVERARIALDDESSVDPRTAAAIRTARAELDLQPDAERRLAQLQPKDRARALTRSRARVQAAIELLEQAPRAQAATAAVPVVQIATDSLGTAVAMRFPDGETAGFPSALRDEHLAPLVGASPAVLPFALADLLPLVGTELAEPLATNLLGRGWDEAILVLGGAAALVPLHAAPLRGRSGATGGSLTDVLTLRLAPAARLLRPSQLPARPARAVAVVDPSLRCGRWEVQRAPLRPERGRDPSAWLAADWIHIAAHGALDARDPLESRIEVPGRAVTLRELLTSRRFGPATVFAPACRAGRVDSANFDEALSVGAGLLAAGAETAIVALWDIPDLATALIVARTYAHLESNSLWPRPEIALRSAQRWLRDASRSVLLAEAAAAANEPSWLSPELAAELGSRLERMADVHPFADPTEWAGLVVLSTRSDAGRAQPASRHHPPAGEQLRAHDP
jgi:hypothetical protein